MHAGLRIYLREGPAELGFGYRIAGRTVSSVLELPRLAAFATPPAQTHSPHSFAKRSAERAIFSGPAFVGGRDRQLECRQSGAVTTVTIEGMGTYELDLEHGAIEAPALIPVDSVEQALCGPCLPLVLAAGGDYLLHAAAVRLPEGIVAISGRSGTGKSTLAAEWASRGAVAVADDALPVRCEADGIQVPGAYPQLKWPRWGGEQGHEGPAPLIGAVELAPGDSPVELVPLSGHQALLGAVEHTVAARLYAPDQLARHFAFCREFAARVPCWRLHYTRQLRNLPAMVECLQRQWMR